MKQIFLIICISLLGLGFAKAETKTEKRNTNPFSEISLRVAANLNVIQGSEHSVEITANERTLDKIIVEINNNKLVIRFSFEDRWMSDFKPGSIEINVVTPDINMLSLQGSGNIYAEDKIETHSLDLNIEGFGDIKLSNVKCDRIEADIAGSGDIILSGKSKIREIEIDIAGSGDVIAYQLETENAYVNIAGSGDCEINVETYLDVKIFGSGDVTYKGNPQINSNVAGSGHVHKK